MNKCLGYCFLFLTLSSFGQNTANVSASEGLFRSNLYSGTPNVSVPISSFSCADITVPITLFYTGGNGLNVNEEASWVGLGWYLQAGGTISQQVRGYNDFYPSSGYYNDISTFPCLNKETVLPFQDTNDNLDCWQTATASNFDYSAHDLEPDVFSLSIPGYSVKFFFDKKKKLYQSEQTDLVIRYSGGTFTATTPDGFTYGFGIKGQSEISSETDARFKTLGSTWYVTSIGSALYSDIVVNFQYVESETFDAKKNIYELTYYDYVPGSGILYPFPGNTYNVTECFECAIWNQQTNSYSLTGNLWSDILCPKNKVPRASRIFIKNQVTEIRSKSLTLKRISGISGYVDFVAGSREDVNSSEVSLADVKVYYYGEKPNENFLRSHTTFNYSYFSSNPGGSFYTYPYPDKNGKRLKLLSVQSLMGSQTLPAYEFEYESAINLPYKTSFDIDHWGYYNYNSALNTTHNTSILGNRESGGIVGSANLLKKITTPLGKIISYEYEAAGSGVRLKKVKDNGSLLTSTIKYDYVAGPLLKPTYAYRDQRRYGETYAPNNLTAATCKILSDGTVMGYTSTMTYQYNVVSASFPHAFSNLNSISPQCYTKITEWTGENGENGKTEYTFPLVAYNQPAYPFVPVVKNSMEGKVIKKVEYKNVGGSFKKKVEQEFRYYFVQPSGNSSTQTMLTNANGIKVSQEILTTVLNGYRMPVSKLDMYGVTTRLFDQNDEAKYITSFDSTVYDPVTYLPKLVASHTKGTDKVSKKFISYFGYTPQLITVCTDNLANTVRYNSFAEYNVFDYQRLVSKYVSNSPQNIPNAPSPVDNSFRKILNNWYNTKTSFLERQYNVLEPWNSSSKTTFNSTTYLWSNKKKLPIASVTNADITQIGFVDFEENIIPRENSYRDILPAGVSVVDRNLEPDNVFTGRFSAKLDPASSASSPTVYPVFNIILVGPEPPFAAQQKGKYKYSFWVKAPGNIGQDKAYLYMHLYNTGSSFYAIDYTPFPAIPANKTQKFVDYNKHDWQYVEGIIDFDDIKFKLSAPSINLSIRCLVYNADVNFPIYVDDIRFHPVESQMTTSTYSMGVGKLSESGPDSKPVFYDYDTFGRLLYVRDFRRNIVKKTQYLTK